MCVYYVCACVTPIAYFYHVTKAVKLFGIYSMEKIMNMHKDLAVIF